MTTRAEVEDRIRVAETLLVQKVRESTVVEHLCRAYDVSERQAARYVKAVRERWRAGAPRDLVSRERRRDELRASIDEAVRRAFQRTKAVNDAKGRPLMRTRTLRDPDGTIETIEEPITVADPDLRAALHGLRLAMVLDGLEQPTGREIVAARPDDEKKGDAETVHREEQATGTDGAELADVGPSPESVVAKLRGLRLVRPEE